MQLKRDITLTDLLGILGLLMTIGGSYYALANRTTTLEDRTVELEKARLEFKIDITQRLDRIEKKLDFSLEKR